MLGSGADLAFSLQYGAEQQKSHPSRRLPPIGLLMQGSLYAVLYSHLEMHQFETSRVLPGAGAQPASARPISLKELKHADPTGQVTTLGLMQSSVLWHCTQGKVVVGTGSLYGGGGEGEGGDKYKPDFCSLQSTG